MKERMQNESMRLDWPDSRVGPKVMVGLQTFMGISEQGLTSFTCPKEGLLEFILSRQYECCLQDSEEQQG